VHLLELGIEINVIRTWLGHVSLDTTNRYAELTLRTKAEALRVCELALGSSAAAPTHIVWKNDKALFEWLTVFWSMCSMPTGLIITTGPW
jgi:hypothetical protein